jgi:hypothetical protein
MQNPLQTPFLLSPSACSLRKHLSWQSAAGKSNWLDQPCEGIGKLDPPLSKASLAGPSAPSAHLGTSFCLSFNLGAASTIGAVKAIVPIKRIESFMMINLVSTFDDDEKI